MNYLVKLGDETILVKNLDRVQGTAEIDGQKVSFDFRQVQGPLYSLIVNDQLFPVQVQRAEARQQSIRLGHEVFDCVIEDERQTIFKKLHTAAQTDSGLALVKAPMPGLVVRLEVQKGSPVSKGQGLIVIEAMKMENEIKSPVAGIISEILVEAHATVEKGTPLLRINS